MNIPTIKNNKYTPLLSSFGTNQNGLANSNLQARVLKNRKTIGETAANIRLPELKEKILFSEKETGIENNFTFFMQQPQYINESTFRSFKDSILKTKHASKDQIQEANKQAHILIRCIRGISITALEFIELLKLTVKEKLLEDQPLNRGYTELFNALENVLVVGSSVQSVIMKKIL